MPDGRYTQLKDYVVFLWWNTDYLVLFLGEVVTQFGNWFNLVASYEVVEHLSQGSGVAIATLLVIRALPRLVWFPIAGAVADTYHRGYVMLVVSLLQGLLAATVPSVLRYNSLWLFLLVVFFEFSLTTFYDPARGALIPMVVPQHQLILSSTLDSLAWSLMGAIGASMGGFAVTSLGLSGCFYIDAVTFLVAGLCAIRVLGVKVKDRDTKVDALDLPALKLPANNTKWSTLPSPSSPKTVPQYGPYSDTLEDADSVLYTDEHDSHGPNITVQFGSNIDAVPAAHLTGRQPWQVAHTENSHQLHASQQVEAKDEGDEAVDKSGAHERADLQDVAANATVDVGGVCEFGLNAVEVDVCVSYGSKSVKCGKAAEEDILLKAEQHTDERDGEGDRLIEHGGVGEGDEADASKAKGQLYALKEGYKYLLAKQNHHVLLFITIKACGALSWGGNDVVNVKWSEMDSMHVIGGEAPTLGLIYGMVGVGCFFGPLFSNSLIPANVTGWMTAIVIAFAMRAAGLMVLVYPNFWILLASSVTRAAGSNILWISSTALLQSTADNERQGCVFALELAMITAATCVSTILTGVGFDQWHWSVPFTCFVLAIVTAVITAFWSVQACIFSKREKEALKNAIQYEALLGTESSA